MSSPSNSLCKPGTGAVMPHTCTLQPSDSSKPHGATNASRTNHSHTAASRLAHAPSSNSSSSSTTITTSSSSSSSSSRAAGSGSRPQLLPSSATTGGRRSLDALIERQDAAASRGVHCSMSEGMGASLDAAAPHSSRQAIGMHDTASPSLRLTCGVSPSAARRSGPYNSSTRSWSFPYAGVSSCQGGDIGLPAGSWMASAAAAAQRGRLAVEAIDEELLMLLQAKEQLEAGRTALYGYSAACSAAPASLSAPLPGSPQQQWEAPHDANGHLAAAQYHHDSQGEPCLQDITLQTGCGVAFNVGAMRVSDI
ncbi:hypothetical protein OEZ86_011931 [Tetradesmus obliquus]|nr:hypothetical protein OEZ86_011931 [Tetradesmus obliquus]